MLPLNDPFFLLVAALTAMVLAAIWGQEWRRLREFEIEADLLREMLERGLSVNEIERLLALVHPVEAERAAKPAFRVPAFSPPASYNVRRYRLRDRLDAGDLLERN